MAGHAIVTGIGSALPDGLDAADLLVPHEARDGSPVDPAGHLGRRGLRYKDRASQLGLCAAQAALADAGLLDETGTAPGGATIGVVVSSNFGNVDTVCRVVDEIAEATVTGTSPMDLPNASSNIVASSIAIRFRLRGANLTLCNGATSGLDAVSWGALLVTTGRVDQVVVVGVETANAVVAKLVGGTDRSGLLDGATALVLETDQTAATRGAPALAVVGAYSRQRSMDGCLDAAELPSSAAPDLWLVSANREAPAALHGVPRCDVTTSVGHASGALGVLQSAAAASWLAERGCAGGGTTVLATAGDPGDDAVAVLVMGSGGPT